MIRTLRFALIALPLLACNKEPGEGGKAEIRGVLTEQRFSASNNPITDPYPLPGENVYIVYGSGDGAFPDDNVDSGPNGEFRFTWLRKGTYTIFAVSDCNDCEGGVNAVTRTVEVTGNKQVLDLGTIAIRKY
ncbi:MAG: hypothetical protein E6Q44_04680 [Flavobacteriales bacterium]|jgi:hypothetical protein|nr:MAG: hypothetical protein E6Q44_04680 [Flavobacteriales bacterium]